MKKRLAVIINAGIGGGFFSQGQPVIGKLVGQLAIDFDVVVYSQLAPNPDMKINEFRICTAPGIIKLGWMRWLFLVSTILYNHFRKPHDLMYAFWGYPAGCVAVLLGKMLVRPSVIHLQGGDATCIPAIRYGVFYGTFSKRFCSWAYKRASVIIALTSFQKQNLTSNGINRVVEVIPYGPDLEMFKFNKNKFRSAIIRFIHIANHSPLKDQKTLLKAFNQILAKKKNCELKFIGYDVLNGSLKKYVNELGVSHAVEFLETIPYDKVPDYLSNADVIMHTSIYEGQATVISEAAACGLLLVGTRVGLLSDLGDDFGVIANVGDDEGLAVKVLNTLENENQIDLYIQQSRKWVEEHDQRWTVNTIKKHLFNLMK